MSARRTLEDHHEVLSEDPFCSGFMDSFGKWNNGFNCPSLSGELIHCCGTFSYRYCCTVVKATAELESSTSQSISERTSGCLPTEQTSREVADQPTHISCLLRQWPLLLGVVIGTLCTIMALVSIAVCICRSRCFNTRQTGHQKQTNSTSECYYAAPSTISGTTSLYGTSSSLSRRCPTQAESNHQFYEQMQEMEKMTVNYPEPSASADSFNNLSSTNFTRTFNNFSCSRPVLTEDFLENSSMSTTSENERHVFVEQCCLPPPMDNIQPTGRMVASSLHHPQLSSIRALPGSLVGIQRGHLVDVNTTSMLLPNHPPAPPSFCSLEQCQSEFSLQQAPEKFSLATKF